MKSSGCYPARPVTLQSALAALWLLGLFLVPPLAAKVTWDPVTPEEQAATACPYAPGASAEMLFVQQTFDSAGADEWTDHYRRIKIYSAKGAEDMGVMNVDYPGTERIWNLAARVIKPDGQIKEYDKKDFNETVAAKLKGSKWKRATLAIPALEAGDILDLKWSSNIDSEAYLYSWWYSQLTLPVRRYNFLVKGSAHDCRLLWFNSTNETGKQAKRGELRLTLNYVPPFLEEPFMPPERDVRSWFMLLYTERALRWYSNEDVWKSLSTYYEEDFRLATRPDATVKAKAAALAEGAGSDEEKLRRFYEFCQEHVTNLDYFDSAELQKAKKRLEDGVKDQSPKETLARGTGYSTHVNQLFAALARAAGFQVTQARSASRHVTLNVRNADGWIFLRDDLVCVRVADRWQKYAPGDYYVPAGMLDPSNELAPALVCLEDKAVIEDNPVSLAERSMLARKGRFVLDAEGNLEGEVEVTMTGHHAIKARKGWHGQPQQEIDTATIEKVTQRLPAAEVTDLKWENLRETRLPVISRYRIKVPAYADAVGAKLIVPVNFFQRNLPALFTADARVHPVYFDYAWNESDDVEIVLPEGYVLEAPSAPRNVGDVAGELGATYRMAYQKKSRTLACKRTFAVGGNGALAFQQASYKPLKRLVDAVKRSDEHALVIKVPEPEPPAAPAEGKAP